MVVDPFTLTSELPQTEPTEQEAIRLSAPQMVEQEIRDMILKRKESSRTFYQPRREKQDKCWNHYRQVYDDTNKESWQSRIFVPASPKVAEVITSNLHAALLGPEQPVAYQATMPEFEEMVRDVNDLIANDLEASQFKVHYTDALRSLCVIGTGIGKVEYKKEYADVQVKERITELPMMAAFRRIMGFGSPPTETTSIKRMIVKDYSCFKNVDRYDIFPEPGTEDISKDRWIIERGKICNYKLIELSKAEENPVINITDELLMHSSSRLKDPDGDKAEKDAANDELQDNAPAYMDPDQEHELLEYWGPAPRWMIQPELYGNESTKYEMVYAWFWLIDGQYVVRRQITPWRDAEPPYIKDVYIRVPGQFDGIGPLELMMNLQIELNEGVNCRQDEINLKLNAPVVVIKECIAAGDWNRLVNGPGALWAVTQTDDVRKALQKIELDGNLNESWRSTQYVEMQIEEVTAAVKATIGSGGADSEAGGGTFRGQLLNKQVAADRFLMYARTSEDTALKNAIRKIYHRIYQFKGMEQITQILGPKRAAKFQFISPEELEYKAKLVPLGVTTMENKGIKLAQMAEQFKMFMGQPWFKPVDHARRMLIVGGDDPDISIMSDEELAQFNEAKRMMIQEAGVSPEMQGMGASGPQSSPVAGNVPGPTDGQPMPATPANGPGAASIDGMGMPL